MSTLFPRPQDRELVAERRLVPGLSCSRCGAREVRQYRLLRISGWRLVRRCRVCLLILSQVEPESPLGFEYKPYSAYLNRKSVLRDRT